MAPRRIQRIPISSREQWLELRKQDVTASVIGALFGCHPYETPAGLWAIKTGVNIPDEDNAAMRRGRLLENAVGQAFMEQSPHWVVKKANVYLRDRTLRLGATPDFFATDPESRRVVLQAKTVNPWEFKRSWTDRDAPFWITLQCLT
jgi:predicted phage-related endonuclease